jgi:hypothetical protein
MKINKQKGKMEFLTCRICFYKCTHVIIEGLGFSEFLGSQEIHRKITGKYLDILNNNKYQRHFATLLFPN